MSPDVINGLFEAVGALLVLNHCRATLKAKAVAGVSIFSTCVFTLWGVWNLWFYPAQGLYWSAAGGVLIVAANTFWISLLVRYRKGVVNV